MDEDFNVVHSATNQAKKAILSTILREHYKAKLASGQIPFPEWNNLPIEVRNFVTCKLENTKKLIYNGNRFCLLTINPKESITFNVQDLRKRVRKFLQHNYIEHALYQFEQRGLIPEGLNLEEALKMKDDILSLDDVKKLKELCPDVGKGYHCHILLDKNDTKPSRLLRDAKIAFADRS